MANYNIRIRFINKNKIQKWLKDRERNDLKRTVLTSLVFSRVVPKASPTANPSKHPRNLDSIEIDMSSIECNGEVDVEEQKRRLKRQLRLCEQIPTKTPTAAVFVCLTSPHLMDLH
jgi:hypothetical protein